MRRWLIVSIVLAAALTLCAAPGGAATINWKMQSTWTAGDFHQNNPKSFAERVDVMSGGRLKINVAAAGAVVPAFEVLDAVHKGILDAGHGWPGYWYGKHPAATLFGSVPGGPFGMNAEDFLGWMYLGGGQQMYNELLQNELKMNVVAFPTFGETPEPLGLVQGSGEGHQSLQGSEVPGLAACRPRSSRPWGCRW